MSELKGLTKFDFIVSLLEESESLKEYVKCIMRGCEKRHVTKVIKEFPVVLADIIFDDWTIIEQNLEEKRR